MLEHQPVYSFGRRVRPEHLLISRDHLLERGAALVESDRGGDLTFHGPGQLVCYPVLDLRRRGLPPSDYVRRLETTIIEALRPFGLAGATVEGRPGIWFGREKIAAIGVRVQAGVATHGFALNVDTDLRWFDAIVPCGLADASVTSIQHLLGFSPGMSAVERSVCAAFENVFDSKLVPAIAGATAAASVA